MIDVSKLNPAEIMQMGIQALSDALGPAGMGLFMHQFEIGSGDYTRDRDKILGNPTINEIVSRAKELRQAQVESSETLPKYTNTSRMDFCKFTQSQIRQMGIEALTQALGSTGMLRFMQQVDVSGGDYLIDRKQILSNITDEEIIASIEKQRQQQNAV